MTIGGHQFRTELIGGPFREGEAKGRARPRAGRGQGQDEGEARGLAEAVVGILEARGLTVSKRLRARIQTDLDILSDWAPRAATVEKAEDLFDRPPAGGCPCGGRASRIVDPSVCSALHGAGSFAWNALYAGVL